jgi:citrate synthase
MSALFPVITSVIAIFSPLLGIGLGVLTSGAHWWKDQNLVQIVKKSEAVVQQLPIHNAQLGNISAEMEIKLKELEQEYNKCLAIVQKIQGIVFQHTETQEILGSTDQKLSDQFQKIEEKLQQLFSMGELAAISHQAKSENLVQETQAIHQQTENLVRNVDRNLTQLDQMTGMVGNLLKTVASQLTHNP